MNDNNEQKVTNNAVVGIQSIQSNREYVPATDILETDKDLTLYMDLPGVGKDEVSINVEKNILKIEGHINSGSYNDLKLIYKEYNVGNYMREFTLSNQIDQSKIEAKIDNGVLTLILPKVPKLQPQQIQVS